MKFFAIPAVLLTALLLLSCKSSVPGPSERGPNWIVYHHAGSPLVNDHINALNVTTDGKLLIGTDSGASAFDIRDNTWSTYKDSLSLSALKKVRAIAQGKDQSLWFGLLGGVARFNQYAQATSRWERYTSAPPLAGLATTAIAIDKSQAIPTVYGEVWVGSNSGVSVYHQFDVSNGTWDYSTPTARIQNAFGTSQVTCGTSNIVDNHIWLGGQTGGVVEIFYELTDYTYNVYKPSFDPGSQTNGIAFDLDKNIWLARNNGACSYNKVTGKWTYYTSDSTGGRMPNAYCHAVETDLHSSRWFGTDSGLVGLLDTTWVKITRSTTPLPSDTVLALKYDFQGNLWIGTTRGLAVYNPQGTLF